MKFTVAYYTGIGECPMIILLDRQKGAFKKQFNSIEDLQREIGLEPTIYFVEDIEGNRVDCLDTWNRSSLTPEKFWEKLKEYCN